MAVPRISYTKVSSSRICLTALRFQLFIAFIERKKGAIQYGYRKWGTHARVFSQTLAHENSKNEIRKRNRRRRQVERREYAKKQAGTKKTEVPTAYHILIKIK